MRNGFGLLLASAAMCLVTSVPNAAADPVPVRFPEGTLHGFLLMRGVDGKVLAQGDLVQSVHGSQIHSQLIFHFKDGSVDEENIVFSQEGHFRLLSDHHIQKGPFFPHPLDISIDAPGGEVTLREKGEDGKEKVKAEHMDLPADLANGMVPVLLRNLPRDGSDVRLPMLVATPKRRVITLVISPAGEEPFYIGGFRRKALKYSIHLDLGGVVGVIAQVVGKQPQDVQIWNLDGEAPVFLKEIGQLYEGSPLVEIDLSSPTWHRTAGKAQ